MGAASLSAVLSLGDGAERFAREQIQDEGLQTVSLVAKTGDTIDGIRAPRYDYPIFSREDAEELAAAVPDAARVVLAVEGTGLSGAAGSRRGVFITGLSVVGGTGTGLRIAHGRDLTAGEMARGESVAVVSSRLARELVGREGEGGPGRDLRDRRSPLPRGGHP